MELSCETVFETEWHAIFGPKRLTLDVSMKPQPHSIHFFWIGVGCQLLISCPNSIFMHVQDNIITSKVLYGGGVLMLDKGHPLGNALHFVL